MRPTLPAPGEFALLRESFLRVHCHTILEEQRAAEVHDEIGQRSLERLFPGLVWSQVQKSARHRIAAKPRIQAMIRDGIWAGLLPEQIVEARLTQVIETGTSTSLSAPNNSEQATTKLKIQKAAQAADEAWQQTVAGTGRRKPNHRTP